MGASNRGQPRPATRAPAAPPQRPSTLELGGKRMGLHLLPLADKDVIEVSRAEPALLFALRASLVEAAVFERTELLDRTNWLVLPAGTGARLRPVSRSPQLVLLEVHAPLVELVVRGYQKLRLTRAQLLSRLHALQVLPRTVWVHEVFHRYLFEREVLSEHDNEATRFLEIELVKELFYLCRDREEGIDRATTMQRNSRPVERALAYIEAHLFEPRHMAALARASGASESTLLRAFKRELGTGPGEYWRDRRLDEALALVRSGERSITEVATLVGYENPTAFSYAFRLRFGRAPSSFVPRSGRSG